MLSPAALSAHFAVVALLAVVALWVFAAAVKKGRGGPRWMLAFFGLWLGTLGLAAYGARWAFTRHDHTPPGFWKVYGPAVACAFLAVLALRWLLAKRPALSAAETAEPAHAEPRPAPPHPETRNDRSKGKRRDGGTREPVTHF